MKSKRVENIIALLVVLAVVFGIGYFVYNKKTAPGEYDQLAQCLTDKGVKMYGAWWCPHCKAQKEAFGNSFDLIDYVECAGSSPQSPQLQICNDEGVEGYPTWKFPNGTVLSGEQSMKKLAETAGCEYNGVQYEAPSNETASSTQETTQDTSSTSTQPEAN